MFDQQTLLQAWNMNPSKEKGNLHPPPSPPFFFSLFLAFIFHLSFGKNKVASLKAKVGIVTINSCHQRRYQNHMAGHGKMVIIAAAMEGGDDDGSGSDGDGCGSIRASQTRSSIYVPYNLI
jgi:hypothetical protein